mgnify:CR=1 FL=1
MDNLRLVNLESLAQFLEEALRAQPVRLSLTQRRSGQAPFITETWYLRLQGWLSNTDLGQLTQLFRVQLGPDGEQFKHWVARREQRFADVFAREALAFE